MWGSGIFFFYLVGLWKSWLQWRCDGRGNHHDDAWHGRSTEHATSYLGLRVWQFDEMDNVSPSTGVSPMRRVLLALFLRKEPTAKMVVSSLEVRGSLKLKRWILPRYGIIMVGLLGRRRIVGFPFGGRGDRELEWRIPPRRVVVGLFTECHSSS